MITEIRILHSDFEGKEKYVVVDHERRLTVNTIDQVVEIVTAWGKDIKNADD